MKQHNKDRPRPSVFRLLFPKNSFYRALVSVAMDVAIINEHRFFTHSKAEVEGAEATKAVYYFRTNHRTRNAFIINTEA